jgi:hypothetical protein
MSFHGYPDPISKFFVEYPKENFPDAQVELFRSSSDWRQQGAFQSLHWQLQWTQVQRDDAYKALEEARHEFVVKLFGTRKLEEDYQKLCEDLEIDPMPENETEMKAALKNVHVNVVDVIQYRWDRTLGRVPTPVHKYMNSEDLKMHARNDNKILSTEIGKIGVLRILLG